MDNTIAGVWQGLDNSSFLLVAIASLIYWYETRSFNWYMVLRGNMALETEVETYNRELPRLLDQQGRFVVIHGHDVVGTYDSYADALNVGYDKFELNPFLVKKIESVEQAQCFGRDLELPCHT